MKQQTKGMKLLYVEEHLSCGKYLKEIDSGFIYQELEKGNKRDSRQEMDKNHLVIVLEGKIRLTCNLWRNKIINGGEIFLIAKSSLVYGECLEYTRVLTLSFESPHTNCEKLNFQYLAELAKPIEYNLDTLLINYPVSIFCELMIIYLEQKANCEHLHEAKHNELFLCLRYFYTKHELARLFYPMLSEAFDFKRFILENYNNVKSVKELIELSHMGKSAFYDKFSKAFGMSAKQWLTNKKLLKIINVAAEPGMTVKRLMAEFDFESLSQFQFYCKHNFDCTPTSLINNAMTGNVKVKNK